MSKIELHKIVYHKDIYWGREPMKIVGIRANEVELEGDYSGGTHAVCQASWVPIEGLLFERAKTKEDEVVNISTININSHEIIEFLNNQIRDNDELCDISVGTPIEFVKQSYNKKGLYTLEFNAYYNNWGTEQLIKNNQIYIDEKGVQLILQEPFDIDESTSVLKNVYREALLAKL